MRNAAMFYRQEDFNEFTDALKTKCETDGKAFVKLRDGQWREIIYANDKDDPDDTWAFRTSDWGFWWYNDGSSCKNSDLDIVEMR